MTYKTSSVAAMHYRTWTADDIAHCHNRSVLISWLCWNDRHGCYTDDDCALEGTDPLSLEEARKLALDAIA